MERKVTIQLPMKEKKINDNGKVVIENWCVFARFLEKRKRRQQKKTIVISKMSEMEKKRFRDACLKLQRERARMEGPLKRRFKKIASLRSVRSAKSEKSIREPDDEYFACPFDYKTHREGKASKQAESKRLNTVPLKTAMKKDSTKRTKPKIDSTNPAKSKSKVDSGESSKPTISQSGNKAVKRSLLKTKHLPPPPQKFQRPVIIIPPFKTRPWVPCPRPVNPRIKPTINYPPLTLRKTPWQPPKAQKIQHRVRLDKTFFPLPVSTLGKTWKLFKFITAKRHILRGKTSQYSKKFNFISNGKQSAFIAIIALVNSQMCAMRLWGPSDLDEIVAYGDINFRRQLRRIRYRNSIKPSDIKLKFYTKRAKITTEIGARTKRGVFDPQDTKNLEDHIAELLDDYNCVIFTYCEQSFAIWKELNAFYIFNSMDCDDHGNTVAKGQGACCVIRSPGSMTQIVDYLESQLKYPRMCYEICSFKVNERVSIEQEIAKLDIDRQSQEVKRARQTIDQDARPVSSPQQNIE